MKEIIIVGALWCPSCLVMHKHYQKIEKEFPEFTYTRLDYDQHANEVKRWNVGKILPVLIVIKEGQEYGRLIGEKSYLQIHQFITGLAL